MDFILHASGFDKLSLKVMGNLGNVFLGWGFGVILRTKKNRGFVLTETRRS